MGIVWQDACCQWSCSKWLTSRHTWSLESHTHDLIPMSRSHHWFFICNSFSMEITYCCYPNFRTVVTAQLMHATTACANICNDFFPRDGYTKNTFSSKFELCSRIVSEMGQALQHSWIKCCVYSVSLSWTGKLVLSLTHWNQVTHIFVSVN